ncbi:TPA: hypothetical protein JQR10_001688 [Shigella flexneri]|uniref:DUF805 domain-containing protein n=3 Tax=Shigella flexneri TaxID=623 RepID=A0A4P7TRJ4_SHIFM|nr:conserved hypothetical protein [Shigella flexneri 5 str. 8401]EFZ2260711.1 hypothetical protein [Shigella flexneri]EID63945.1 hypothetical protein SF5M90T_3600 [Shigella flexneri 5a str. M90T]EFZ2445736.1 hypothetical protein [Shigella flexneri]EFZ2466461.1 hypothetical protein [Shigella flexneri]
MLTGDSHKDVKFMLRMFIPTSNGKISRHRYIFSFILINFIFAFLIIFFNDGEAGFLVIVSTIALHYLVINMNCQRLRDSGFIYIKIYGTLAVYIISIITMIAEDFACSGNGSMIFLICYFSTFSMLMLAPTDSSKQ